MEREINEDKAQNITSPKKVSITNNHFNADPINMLKRTSQVAGEATSEGKKPRMSVPIVSPSSSYSGSYGGNTTKVYYFTFATRILVVYLAKGSANGDLG